MTTTDPQTPAPWDPTGQQRAVEKVKKLGKEHRKGWHTSTARNRWREGQPVPGCAGCLLSGALETEGVGE